jgi:peptide/nickel transport system substrate-binding protein
MTAPVGRYARTAAAAPDGQLIWGVHISLAPTWFDPAETPGIVTPFMHAFSIASWSP